MQKEVTFSGIDRATNARAVNDGAMSEMMNLMPGADGLNVISMPPVVNHGGDNELMCVHYLPDGGVRYIYRRIEVETPIPIEGGTPTESGSDSAVDGDGEAVGGDDSAGANKCLVVWKTEPTGAATTLMQTTSVITNQLELLQGIDVLGNTLILRWSKRIVYALWRSDTATYELLGEKPPMTQIQFGLRGTFASYPDYADKSKNKAQPDNWKKYENSAYEDGGESSIGEDGWIIWNETFYKASFPCPFQGYKKRVPYTHEGFSAESLFKMATNNDDNDNNSDANGDRTATIVMNLTNLVMGAVNKFIAQQGSDKNRFVMPFLVRYAYRMFDNTHIMHSVPVLMIPNSKAPVVWWRPDSSIQGRHSSEKSYARREPYVYARVSAMTSKLMMRKVNIPADLWKWRDVIQGIDVYVSQPLYTYKQDEPVYGWDKMWSRSTTTTANNWKSYYHDGNIEEYNVSGEMPVYAQRQWYNVQSKVYSNKWYEPKYKFTIKERTEAEIAKDVKECSTFFKVASLRMEKLVWEEGDVIKTSTNANISRMEEVEMEEGLLNSLTSQEKLDDDYKSHYSKSAKATYIYNNRLNLGDVTEEVNAEANNCLVAMPTNFIGYSSGKSYFWRAEVELVKNGKTIFVRQPANKILTGYDADYPRYVFVPDADAKRVHLTRYLSEAEVIQPRQLQGGGAVGDITGDENTIIDGELKGENIDDSTGTEGNENFQGNVWTDTTDGTSMSSGPNKVQPNGEIIDDGGGGTEEEFKWYPIGETDAFTAKNVGTYVIELEPSEFMNGAVWFKGYDSTPLSQQTSTHNATGTNYTERVNYLNKIYTSNAANPFRFEPSNINTIGTGRIKAMRAAVTPVRANQVGQLSMYAFSEDGVWSLKVSSSTGGWSGWEIVNGDVVSNAASVCQLDNAVAYITAQGVKIIQGAESACISLVLDGRLNGVSELLGELGDGIDSIIDGSEYFDVKFKDYIVGAGLAYDYTNNRLVCFNGNYMYCYVYNLANPGWGAMGLSIASAVNDYPTTWVNLRNIGSVGELSAKHDDEQTNVCYFVTRAMKLDAADVFKTINELIVRHNFEVDQFNSVVLFGSRDLMSWHVVAASKERIRAKHGSGYKFFKLLMSGDFPTWGKILGATINLSAKMANKVR